MGALAHYGAVALPNTNFWDPAGFTADGSVENFKRRRQTELKHGRISMLGALVPPAASAGPAANRGRNLLSDVYDRCLQVSSMCSWSIPSRIRNMMAHMTYGNTTFEDTLKQLLLQKGVPPRIVDQRVQAAIKAIGATKLKEAVAGKEHDSDLFGRLKSLGDEKKFRWVLREESQALQLAKKNRPPLPRAKSGTSTPAPEGPGPMGFQGSLVV